MRGKPSTGPRHNESIRLAERAKGDIERRCDSSATTWADPLAISLRWNSPSRTVIHVSQTDGCSSSVNLRTIRRYNRLISRQGAEHESKRQYDLHHGWWFRNRQGAGGSTSQPWEQGHHFGAPQGPSCEDDRSKPWNGLHRA